MPARKAGGKYKGKIPRVKGEATLQAELEAKRRKAYEAQIARLQERRQAELMAARGLRSAQDEEDEAKRQRIMAMFGGGGRAGRVKKFFKYWKIGMIQVKKDRALAERKFCWRRSCEYCGDPNDESTANPGQCSHWWTHHNGRDAEGELAILKVSPLDPRPTAEIQRKCDCCGMETGIKAAGCRAFDRLRDPHFEMPFEAQRRRDEEKRREIQELQASGLLPSPIGSARSGGSLQRRALMTRSTSLSFVEGEIDTSPWDRSSNFNSPLSSPGRQGLGTTMPDIRNMSGNAMSKSFSATQLLPMVQEVPEKGEDGKPLREVAHHKSGMRAFFDKYSGKMWLQHAF